MKRLILHIGTAKTGTTSIQRFLYANSSLLSELGVRFPDFNNGFYGPVNGNSLMVSIAGLAQDIVTGTEDLNTLREAIAEYDTVLLSCEGFWSINTFLPGDDDPLEKGVRYWSLLKDMCRSFGVERFTLIVYLRRQDIYLSSAWKQRIRAGETDPLDRMWEVPYFTGTADYDKQIRMLERVFPDDEIVVRPFGEDPFEGGDIYHDFTAAAGIDWDPRFVITESTNTSWGADVSEAVRRFLLMHPDTAFKRKVIFPLASRCNWVFPGKEKTLFTPDEQEEIYKKYRDGNDRIAGKYLGRGTLFLKPGTISEYWIPDEKLIRRITALFSAACKTRKIPGSFTVLSKIPGLVYRLRGRKR